MSYFPVECVGTIDGQGMPVVRHFPEKAAMTFKKGTPVVSNGGYVNNANSPTDAVILGISAADASGLTSDGVGIDGTSLGTPQGQANAKIIAVGSPVKPSHNPVYVGANGRNVFSANLKAAQTYSDAMLGVAYKLTLDAASGAYYIDTTTNGATAAQCARVIGMDPRTSNTDGNVRVLFVIPATADALA